MLAEFERGFHILGLYAKVTHAPQLAARIALQRDELLEFLDREELSKLPRTTLNQLCRQDRDEFYDRRQTHLAIVAQEALKTSGGEFVHPTSMSVVRALRERVATGDQRILTHYTDRTLAHQIRDSANGVARLRDREILSGLVQNPNFAITYSNQVWQQILREWSITFPQNTSLGDIASMLWRFTLFSKILPVEERLQTVRHYDEFTSI